MQNPLSIFDSYSRRARVYPALIATLPIVYTVIAFQPSAVLDQYTELALSLFSSFGGLILLSNIARSRGKIAEKKLITKWGGWPTTILLRHSDRTIDTLTKARYHGYLSKLASLDLPSETEELIDPQSADLKYRSATKLLIEARRSQEYHLVMQELIAYGFRRNLLGLKPIAMSLSVASTCLAALIWAIDSPPVDFNSTLQDLNSRAHLYILVAANCGYLALIGSLVNDSFVRQSADDYAEAIFKTLEPPHTNPNKQAH